MGTNYYAITNECAACGRHDVIHLGKSSAGWQFTFQYNGGRLYKNVREMKRWLSGKVIHDEYGQLVTHADFWKMVENKQKHEPHNHALEYPSNTTYLIERYSFSDGEFS